MVSPCYVYYENSWWKLIYICRGQQSAAVEEEKHAQAKSIATFDDHSLGAISVAFRKDGSSK